MLEIRFLSEDKLILNGKVLDQKVSSKALAVIAMLILKKEHSLPKREIINSLWPESSEEAAKYNLRFNLWQLKKAFDEEWSSGFLVNERTTVRIGEDFEYFCDVEDILDSEPEKTENPAELSRLAELFKCEFFMDEYFPGCSEFNDMIIMKRYALENMRLRIIKRFLEIAPESENAGYILQMAEDGLAIDPYDEELAKIKLEKLIALGQKREATGFYHSFRMKLMSDIGKEPEKEISGLAGSIPKEEAASGKTLNLAIFSMNEVEYFWLSELIRALLEEKAVDLRHFMGEEDREVLASVSARLGTSGAAPSEAKLMDTALKVFGRMVKEGFEISVSDVGKGRPTGAVRSFLDLATMRFSEGFRYRKIDK